MAVYDVNGTDISLVYDVNGNLLSQAYDINQNELLYRNIVVMSYNVQWFTGINSNSTLQSEIFAAYEPDIIGFQEFQKHNISGIPALATQLLSNDYPYISMGNYGNKNAMASKYELKNFITIPHTTQTMDGQSYSTATVTIDNKDIFIVVSHVTTSDYEAAKVEQVGEIFTALQGHEYFILMADFNTVCKSVNDPEYTTIMKQFVDACYHVGNCSLQHGFIDTWTSGTTANGTWYPCDNIITSSNIIMNNVIADQRKVEAHTGQSIDHLAFVAYLTIT